MTLALVGAAGVSCSLRPPPDAAQPGPVSTAVEPAVVPGTAAPSTVAPQVADTQPPADRRAVLGALAISDSSPPAGYRRDEWPHWLDLDGNGCDTRDDALVASSEIPVVAGGCDVVSGRWTSAYDGKVFTTPEGLDADHFVPLGNAFISGGDAWSTDQRAAFANDPGLIWIVSAGTNRSKSDRAPDAWRPPRSEIWCRYAQTWVSAKVRYHLTATTPERDALGQMLDTCPDGPQAVPPATPDTTTAPSASTATSITPAAEVYHRSCAEARAAGHTPLLRGEPGYRDGLDGDRDGMACE